MNDFPGVVVKQNNFMMKGLSLDLDPIEEPEQLLVTPRMGLKLDLDLIEEPMLVTPRVMDHKSISINENLLVTPRVMDHKSISKSEYISKTISLTNTPENY